MVRWSSRAPRRDRWDGTHGRPPSGNGASSFHLVWEVPSGIWVEVRAVLTVIDPPTVDRLHFWALQVGFGGPGGGGGAHLGLQWYGAHPGSTAANWGGYAPGGGELRGGPLAVPSATGNPNTGDLPWRPGDPYRLVVRRAPAPAPDGAAAWQGIVVDLVRDHELVLRELWGGGTHLTGPMVWSEVFADCDAPSSAVRWSELEVVDADGVVHRARRVRLNYQRIDDGGCAATDACLDSVGVVQRTSVPRRHRQGTALAVP